MANVFFWSTFWDGGPGLQPGATQDWWLIHSDWDERSLLSLDTQVNITAHPWGSVQLLTPPAELTVENVRSRITPDWKRVMYFTIRNSGPSPVTAYGIGFSFISE